MESRNLMAARAPLLPSPPFSTFLRSSVTSSFIKHSTCPYFHVRSNPSSDNRLPRLLLFRSSHALSILSEAVPVSSVLRSAPFSHKRSFNLNSNWRYKGFVFLQSLEKNDFAGALPCDTKLRTFIASFKNNGGSGSGSNNEGVFSGLELERGTRKVTSYNAVFALLIINLAVFLADHVLKIPAMKNLYFFHTGTQWYQFFTSLFCHVDWNHLSGNLFFVYIFGKLLEEEEGGIGVWTTYLITGIGANLASWWLLPSYTVSVGASGAVFGLFAVSVLIKLSWNWRKLLEAVILGQFVIEKIISEAQATAALRNGFLASRVNHVAHLAGALAGVLLIWMLTKLPTGDG